ncbi:glycosyltransferase family 1 protein [Bremerella cremea]|uniref:Glycosyltransferase family 1 protein n=2 Tax=Bremerella cremea TaxID=1031537 RepID=A0A368KZJ1_9BACT|nr:glycosyltransferase family 1 protein [Bremerella cremea]
MLSPPNEQQETDNTESTRRSLAKVAHVINGEFYSGAERVQDLLGKCLPQFGYDVSFVCVKPGQFAQARSASVGAIYDMPMRHRFDLWQSKALADLVKKEQFQIVHAHTPRTAMIGMGAAYLANVPFIYHVHSPTSRDSTNRWRNWFNQRIEQVSVARANKLICVSNSLAAHMKSMGVADNRLAVVHNGVPQLANVPERELPVGNWTLGTVALFRPRKGLEVLLEAIAELRQAGQPVCLRAVGRFETVDYEQKIQELVAKLNLAGAIEWVGFTQDVNAEFAKMDLFVLPSLFGEGLPMVVLEAMAAGVPVMATDVEGVTEAIVDGESGMIAKPNDAQNLAQKIEAVLIGKVDWREIRRNALARHAESFSDVAMARGVATVYDEVLPRSTPVRMAE